MTKYVYSEKAKKVLSVEEGTPSYDLAVQKGYALFDDAASALAAVNTGKSSSSSRKEVKYIISKTGEVLKTTGDAIAEAASKGYAVYDSKEQATQANAPIKNDGAPVSSAPKVSRSSQLRRTALEYMDRVYAGDLLSDLKRLEGGDVPDAGENTDDQKRFIETARRVYESTDDDGVYNALEENPALAERLALEHAQKSWHGGSSPSGKAILFPNLTYRSRAGAGTVSKIIGGAEDVFSLLPRAARAGIEETMPISEDATFAERMAIPHELLSAPQAMFTEGASSILPGVVTEKVAMGLGKAAAKSVPAMSRVAQKLSHAKGETEALDKAIRGIDDAATLSKGQYIRNQAVKGLGEGAAYGAHPTALELTSPDEGSGGRAALTAGLSLAMGPAGRAAFAASPMGYRAGVRNLDPSVLSPAGKELQSGAGPYERIGAALAADERVLDKGGVPRAISKDASSRLRTLSEAAEDVARARDALNNKKWSIFSKFGEGVEDLPEPLAEDVAIASARAAGIADEEIPHILARATRDYPGTEMVLPEPQMVQGAKVPSVVEGSMGETTVRVPGAVIPADASRQLTAKEMLGDLYPLLAQGENGRLPPHLVKVVMEDVPGFRKKVMDVLDRAKMPISREGNLLGEVLDDVYDLTDDMVYPVDPLYTMTEEAKGALKTLNDLALLVGDPEVHGPDVWEGAIKKRAFDPEAKDLRGPAREAPMGTAYATPMKDLALDFSKSEDPTQSMLNAMTSVIQMARRKGMSDGEIDAFLTEDGVASLPLNWQVKKLFDHIDEGDFEDPVLKELGLLDDDDEALNALSEYLGKSLPKAKKGSDLARLKAGAENQVLYPILMRRNPKEELLPVYGPGLPDPTTGVQTYTDEVLPFYGPGLPEPGPEVETPDVLMESFGPPKPVVRNVPGVDRKLVALQLADEAAGRYGAGQDGWDALYAAQRLTHYKTGLPLPTQELGEIQGIMDQLPAPGGEEAYLRKMGQSRLKRLTGIEPFREGVDTQLGVNWKLGTDYAWDIPAVVGSYRESQRPTLNSPMAGLIDNLLAVKAAKAAPTVAKGVAKSVEKGVRTQAPTAGARQSLKQSGAQGDVPQLYIIAEGGLLPNPFIVNKKFKSVKDMD